VTVAIRLQHAATVVELKKPGERSSSIRMTSSVRAASRPGFLGIEASSGIASSISFDACRIMSPICCIRFRQPLREAVILRRRWFAAPAALVVSSQSEAGSFEVEPRLLDVTA
jgi:hypothetical protein